MPAHPTVTIIADDFTGACDTGAQMAHPTDPCPVLLADSAGAVPAALLRSTLTRYGRLVCDTESRHISPDVAAGRVRDLSRSVALITEGGDARVNLVYKKIDSTLRGNTGAELSALQDAFPDRFLLIAPAFPAAGRTTVDGCCLVNGVPVDQTEFGGNSLSPVRGSRIADLLPSRIRVEECQPGGLESLLLRVRPGTAIVVDGQTDEDLNLIVTVTADHLSRCVFVGSAGLAAAFASGLPGWGPVRHAPAATAPGSAGVSPGVGRRRSVLGLVGSLSARSRAQAQLLAESSHVVSFTVDASDVDPVLSRVLAALADNQDVLLLTPQLSSAISAETARLAGQFASMLGRIARRVVSNVPDVGLFLTGGDTAFAAIRAIDGKVIHVYREIEQGVPVIGICTANRAEVLAVTKAGGFGADDTMLKAFSCLREERCLR